MRSAGASRVVLFVFLTVFLDLVGFGIIAPLLPLYVKSMGGNAETVGVLFSSFSLTQLVATPILGRVSDRYGRRRVILTSLAGNAASMVLFAVATNLRALPILFVSRIVAGATAGNIAACQAAIADVTTGAERAKGMGRVGAAIGLGMVLGPVIGGWASKLAGPSAPPLAAAALASLDLIAAFALMPETRVARSPESPAHAPRAFGAVLGDPRLLAVLALFFLTFLYMTNLQVALPLLASQRLQWTEKEIGNVFGVFGLLMFIVQGGLIGRMTRAFGARNLVIGGELSSVAGLLVIASAHATWSLACGLVLLALGLGIANPVLSTLASERAGPSKQGVVLGVAQSAGGLARTIGPIGVGLLYARVGPSAPFVGGAIAALIAVGIGVGVRATDAGAERAVT